MASLLVELLELYLFSLALLLQQTLNHPDILMILFSTLEASLLDYLKVSL